MPEFPDLDLRLVRYFTVVAEHRNFGRAAGELHITQPSLSRQVRHLEQQLGARLLDRTPQGSTLTEAGEVFLEHAKKLLHAANRATAAVREAASPARITIGYSGHIIVTPAVQDLRRRNPDAEVVATHVPWDQPHEALLEHRVDAVVTRLPLTGDDLDVSPLYDEPRHLLISVDHRLAGKESVTLDDIADEPMPRLADPVPEWDAFWRIDPRPDGRPAPDGPIITAIEDKFELVASGQVVAVISGGLERFRPDVTTVPLHDVEPSHVVLVTRAGERNPLVAEFRESAKALLTGPPET